MARSKVDHEGLDDFERALVEAYCISLHQHKAYNAVQLARGAKPGTRQAASHHFLKPQVEAAINRRLSERSEYHDRLRRLVINKLADALDAKLEDCFDEEMKLKKFEDMPDSVRNSLSEVSPKVHEDGVVYRVKLMNQATMTKLAMEHLGMFAQADPMEEERRKISDARPELHRRIAELGANLRAAGVHGQPESGATERPAV